MNTTTTANMTSAGNKGFSYKWIVALTVIFGLFMSILDSTIVNIAVPRLQSVFGANLTSVQWVLTGYTLAQGVATPLTGFLADRLGTKRLYILALIIFTCCSALCGFAWNFPSLICFRIFQAAGGAFLAPISITLLYSEFPPAERGMAMGVLGVPILVAPALGPTLGGYLITYSGWQLIFYINVPIGILGVLMATTFLRELPRNPNAQFDMGGFILSTIGLASVLYAFSDVATDGWGSKKIISLLVLGSCSLILFIIYQFYRINVGKDPLLNLRLFSDKSFTPCAIASLFVTFILFGGLFLLPLYLQILRGLSPYQAGLFLLPQALASMVVVVLGGRLVDKVGTKRVVVPGLLFLLIPMWGFMNLSTDTPYGWFQVLLILRGGEIGLVMQPLMRAALVRIPSRQLSQASSLLTVSRFVGGSLITAILGTLVQSQQKIHYVHLAEQVVPGTAAAQLLQQMQAFFHAHGMNTLIAYNTAIADTILMLQKQAYNLALQDGYRLTFVLVFPAVLAVLFLQSQPKTASKAQSQSTEEESISEEAFVFADM